MGNINSKTTITPLNNAGSQVLPTIVTLSATGNEEVTFSQAITGSTTNVAYVFNLDPAKVAYLIIHSDVTCTVKTNSSGSPTDTISLTGGTPKMFPLGTLAAIPFTAAITTGIFVTVPGATSGTLTIYAVTAL